MAQKTPYESFVSFYYQIGIKPKAAVRPAFFSSLPFMTVNSIFYDAEKENNEIQEGKSTD